MPKRTRARPNVLVTGTPGCGKTTLAAALASATGLTHIDVGVAIKDEALHSGWDESFQCHTVDEDKVVDALEARLSAGGCVVDYHSCGFFPERWFQLVVVLRTNNTVLYDRLAARNYSQKKVTENIDCEIFGVVAEEAADSYAEGVVRELVSETEEDKARNLAELTAWVVEHEAQPT